MKIINKLVLLVLALGFIAVASVNINAQTNVPSQGWYTSVEILGLMATGNDSHVGDIFTVRSDLTEKLGASRMDYGVDHTPLVVRPKAAFGLMLSGGYRKGRWGASVQGWGAEVSGGLGGRVTSPDFVSETSQNVVGVQLWDQSLTPVVNRHEKSGFSPVDYHAEDGLSVMKADFLVENSFLNTPNSRFGLQAGVSAGRLVNSRAEGQKQTASVELKRERSELDPKTFEPIPGTEKQVQENFDNEIQIESISGSRMTMVGPSFGLVGQYRFRRLDFNWQATGSLLFGQAEEKGLFVDIDDARMVERVDGVLGKDETTYLNGLARTSRNALDMTPVLELRAGVSYHITDHVSVGVGAFVSTWYGVKMAPSWHVPGHWQELGGTRWQENIRNPTFLGVRASVGWRF
ncbi:MAG: hypothetical protein Q7R93_05620 [bacterium]|nr:hypothetical protein [bacterium]